jgi:predicted TPR repeat methyltransferase
MFVARSLRSEQRENGIRHGDREEALEGNRFVNTLTHGIGERIAEAEKRYEQGDLQGAETLFRAVLEADARNFDALNRLGAILAKQARYEEAARYLRAALEQNAQSATAHYSLGIVQSTIGLRHDAMASYRSAIAIDPDFAEAHVNLGNLLDGARQAEAAIASYRRAIEIKPDLAAAYQNLGDALLRSRQPAAAAAVFRQWLALDPTNEIAAYLYALASGEDVVRRAPNAWIERTFDTLAASYDAHLQRLRYRAPYFIADALARASGARHRNLVALDAGCGTGLCGPLIRPYVGRLVGVDLSSGMLERAKARDVYDELYHGELVAYLDSAPDTFDLIASADTLIYFGPLDDVLQAAHRAMRTGGLLIFNVEEGRERRGATGYRLQQRARYSHSHGYLRRALRAAGFGVLAIESAALRLESGRPVAGLVATSEKMEGSAIRTPLSQRLRAARMKIRRIASSIRQRV